MSLPDAQRVRLRVRQIAQIATSWSAIDVAERERCPRIHEDVGGSGFEIERIGYIVAAGRHVAERHTHQEGIARVRERGTERCAKLRGDRETLELDGRM